MKTNVEKNKQVVKKVSLTIGLMAEIGVFSIVKSIVPIPDNAKFLAKFGRGAIAVLAGEFVGNRIYHYSKDLAGSIIDGISDIKEAVELKKEGSEEDEQ